MGCALRGNVFRFYKTPVSTGPMMSSGSDGQRRSHCCGTTVMNVLTANASFVSVMLTIAQFVCFIGGRLGSREGHQRSQ